jgi:UDP:flavonoid glycosyltransferase YjiC (YdhE family)
MTSAKRILVLGTSAGGGDWPPLAAVTVGLHQAGHTVQCFGDPAIAQDFASAGIAVEVVPAEEPLGPFMARWQSTGAAGPRASRVWADACLPAVCALVRAFRPQLVLSQLFTMELAGRTKAACGLRWCFINPAYYFGPDSLRPFEVDLAAPWGPKQELRRAIGEADLVLHATDELFDPPPSSLPPHHRYVGPLMWERASEAPPYLDVPGDPWVLVTLSSAPQFQEEQIPLARTALRTLTDFAVRIVVTLSVGHPRNEMGPVPANARIERFVPHSQVLTRSRLLVSPAAHGVVTKALYYGVPMVLIPWSSDQPGVAARAAALGVAEVVERHDLTERRLAAAIHKVLGTPRYQENAARIASHLHTRDAVALARARIEELLETT